MNKDINTFTTRQDNKENTNWPIQLSYKHTRTYMHCTQKDVSCFLMIEDVNIFLGLSPGVFRWAWHGWAPGKGQHSSEPQSSHIRRNTEGSKARMYPTGETSQCGNMVERYRRGGGGGWRMRRDVRGTMAGVVGELEREEEGMGVWGRTAMEELVVRLCKANLWWMCLHFSMDLTSAV